MVDNSTLTLLGTIEDLGALDLNGGNDRTELAISGAVALVGGGQVALSDSTSNLVAASVAGSTLTNYDTISGAGRIGVGDSALALTNHGTVDATGSVGLVIDTGNPVINRGILEATAGSGLTIDGAVHDNGGNIIASGAKVTVDGAVTGSGAATIIDSTLEFGAAADAAVTFATVAGGSGGILKLDAPQSFFGTVAGMGQPDAIDLANFAFSGGAKISEVTGTGAVGTDTNVTVTDRGLSTTLHLLNQYASQFAVDAGAYTLTVDSASSNAGTLLHLATPHAA